MRPFLGRVAAVGTRAHKWIGTIFAGATGVAAVAVAGLLIEHLFLHGWDGSERFWSYVWWLCAALIGWALVVEWRAFLSRTAGSLYHVRLIPASMRNWHSEAQDAARGRFQRLLEVTRSVETAPDPRGVADVRDDVRFVEDKIHDLFNADDERTGFTVAPDILWPLSFGLGSRLTLPPRTRFRDFGTGPLDAFEWRQDEAADRGFVPVESTQTVGSGHAGIHVHAALTGDPDHAPLPFGVRRHIVVGALRDGAPVKTRVGTSANKGAVHPAEAVTRWVHTIHRALHESAEEPVLLSARAPKAVALAAGYAFIPAHMPGATPRSKDPGCGVEDCDRPACRRPWNYLLPLTYDQQAKTWNPVWLLREQRDPHEILDQLQDAP